MHSDIQPIFILWFQGWHHAPKIVKECALSWQRHNPDWQVIRLDSQTLQGWCRWKEAIPNIKSKKMSPQAASDIIRLALLRQYGGIWADSTLFCCRPLDDWLELGTQDPFFAFRSADPSKPISSWFLAADSDSRLLNEWYALVIKYWTDRERPDHYFWVHRLFAELTQVEDAKHLWESVPIISNEGPHLFHKQGFSGKLNEQIRMHVRERRSPVYKLTWKKGYVHEQPRVRFLKNYDSIKCCAAS